MTYEPFTESEASEDSLTLEGLEVRREFDKVAATLVKAFHVDVIALGGT